MPDSAYAILMMAWKAITTYSEATWPQKIVIGAFLLVAPAFSVAVVATIVEAIRKKLLRIRENITGLLGW